MKEDKKLSLESRLTHYLGCLIFGTPKNLGMQDDFHYVPSDRSMPTSAKEENWLTLRNRIATNHFRRYLTVHILRRITLPVIVGTVAVLLLTLIMHLAMTQGVPWVKEKWQSMIHGQTQEQSYRN